MLRGIDPLISPDLLHILASMGHGDTIALVDANFPAASSAKRLVTISGANTTEVLRAMVPLFPIDSFIAEPLVTMQVVGDADAVPQAVQEYRAVLHPFAATAVPRKAFYECARAAFAIVQTGDRRLYANILLTKGVIEP